jgi:hypothetical protein
VNNLAELLRQTNRHAEAEPLYRRALAIFEISFGPEHPSTVMLRESPMGLEVKTRRSPGGLPPFQRLAGADLSAHSEFGGRWVIPPAWVATDN